MCRKPLYRLGKICAGKIRAIPEADREPPPNGLIMSTGTEVEPPRKCQTGVIKLCPAGAGHLVCREAVETVAQALSVRIREARRETFREAVFLCTMLFWAARMISGCAARRAAWAAA